MLKHGVILKNTQILPTTNHIEPITFYYPQKNPVPGIKIFQYKKSVGLVINDSLCPFLLFEMFYISKI
jgi:hypothetical protein